MENAVADGNSEILDMLLSRGFECKTMEPDFKQPNGYIRRPYIFTAVDYDNLETLKIVLKNVPYKNEAQTIYRPERTLPYNYVISNIIGHAASISRYEILEYLLNELKQPDVDFPCKVVTQEGIEFVH